MGGVAKTTNGGVNWELQLGQEFKPNRVFFVNSNTGWATYTLGVLYKSTNGGNNWFTQYNFSHGISDLFMASSDTGWISGGATGILKTTNGGNNWVSQNNPGAFGDAKFFFLNNTTGWLGSGLSRVLATKNGETWGLQITPSGNFYNVFFLDTSYGFAGGSKIIKTTDGGGPINSIGQISNQIPIEFELQQNYPNPFNPITNLKFKIKSLNFVTLSVLDITGKEIIVLVKEELSPGEYEYQFNGAGLTSGIYFYRLTAGSFEGTKRMLLVK